ASADHADYHRQSYQPSSPHAYYILDFYSDSSLACSPAMILHTTKGENSAKQLVRGDSEGQVIIWTLPDVSERQMTLVRQESFDRLPALPPRCSTTLQDVWDNLVQSPAGIIDGFSNGENAALNITATIFIPSQGKLACGRENGTIIIVSAMKSIILQLLEDKFLSHDKIPLKVLQGHDGRITSLLYPFNESTRYEVNHLLSGSADFSVILWDIVLGVKLHTFTVHGGEITQLLVPPDKCNPRILSSVCSVAADHTVTLLSLKERKCILMAARHLFPVQCIRWRPLDDFMVVSCSDGTVYVWQMETGHLDRVVHGMTGEEILNNCDENAMPVDQLINPNITLVQALKRRNLATFKNLAQQKLQSLGQQQQTQDAKLDFSRPQDYPMHIQGIRTNSRDPESHVIFFDTESLIVQLLTDEFSTMSPGELEAKGMFSVNTKRSSQSDISEAQTKIAEIISKGKDRADTLGQKNQQTVETAGFTSIQTQSVTEDSSRIAEIQQLSPLSIRKKNNEPFQLKTMTMEIAQLFMSFLHAWGLDPDLDKLCLNKLGLLKPKCPISYGLLSREGHMSLMLPGWHKRVCQEEINNAVKERILAQKKTLIQQARSASQVEVGKSVKLTRPTLASLARNDGSDQSCDSDSGPSKPPKQDDTVLQEETKLFSTKARWQISSAVTTQHLLSVISVANTLMSMNHATFRTCAPIKKSSSKRAHGNKGPVMAEVEASFEHGNEDETGDLVMLQQSQIKQGWSLLAALHCVLLPELVGSGEFDPPSLEMLARRWQERCLEIREASQALLLAELRRLGPEGRKSIVDNWSPYLPTYVDPNVSLLSLEKADEEEMEEEIEQVLTGESPVHKPSKSFENRCKQATAIVMLAVIGAEFGHEIEPSKRKEESKKSKKSSQEGFTLSNYSLARHTSKALTFLLHQPPSKKLPAHTPIRRAAIDLIGRGFTVWEPYLDVSAVLLGLLEICIDADKLVPCMTFGLPLSPGADACRTARHALSLIATARPPAFIITMAKEVARYNAMAQSSQSQHSQPNNTVLMRAKTEILRMVELLVEKMPSDVADHLIEVMDVTLHCLDVSQLKAKGLTEIFPAICRFSMVCCCNVTKRIWVGAKNGAMAFYEMKQHSKCQMIHAHSGPVIALSVSPDGKYLVSYSHADGKLKVWQTASSSIFGIGSQQTKCTKQMATPPLQVLPHTNLLKLVRLVWIDNRSVVMLTVNGDEIKYSI
ncbi:hypothetical protein ACJMK2_010864, partial [Sinanodonta woodiana]